MPTSLGPAEILVILVVALIVLGPKRLPEAGRQVGKAIAEIRRWTTDVKSDLKSAIDVEVPVRSTVVEPEVVSAASTGVEVAAEPPVSSVAEPVAMVADTPAVAVDEPAVAVDTDDPPATEAAATEPVEPPATTEPATTEAGATHPAATEAAAGPEPSTVELPESPSGDPARI
jgi:Tat protein translocase TatB subunit